MGPSLDREEEEEGEAFSFKWYFCYLLDAFLKKSGFSDQFNQETGAKFLWTLHQMKEGFLSSLLHLSRENRRERERERGEESKNVIRCLGRLAQCFRLYLSTLSLSLSHSLGRKVPGRSGFETSSVQRVKKREDHAMPCHAQCQ